MVDIDAFQQFNTSMGKECFSWIDLIGKRQVLAVGGDDCAFKTYSFTMGGKFIRETTYDEAESP